MSAAEKHRIVLASRASELAQIQTRIVLGALETAFPDHVFGTSFMSTQGDKDLSRALYLIGGKALWTKELEEALLRGEVDMIVHSLKDIPTMLPEGCALGAILEREYGEDSLVVKNGYTVSGRTVHTLDDLPSGAVIGTSSVRRVAQLKRRYPGLVFKDVVRYHFNMFMCDTSLAHQEICVYIHVCIESEETCASYRSSLHH